MNDALTDAVTPTVTRLKSLITRTSKALLQPLTKKDSATPFTVKKAEALLGFSAECTSMLALHITEMQKSHVAHINSLTARLQQLQDSFNEVITARTTEVE